MVKSRKDTVTEKRRAKLFRKIQDEDKKPIPLEIKLEVLYQFYGWHPPRPYSMQVGNARKLKLVAIAEYGDVQLEDAYHKRFKSSHYRGEWYYLSDDIIEEMDLLHEGYERSYKTFDEEAETIRRFLVEEPKTLTH